MGDIVDYIMGSFPDGYWEIDEDPEHDNGPPRTYRACRLCGQDNLIWNLHGGQWRLWEGDPASPFSKMHVCKNLFPGVDVL